MFALCSNDGVMCTARCEVRVQKFADAMRSNTPAPLPWCVGEGASDLWSAYDCLRGARVMLLVVSGKANQACIALVRCSKYTNVVLRQDSGCKRLPHATTLAHSEVDIDQDLEESDPAEDEDAAQHERTQFSISGRRQPGVSVHQRASREKVGHRSSWGAKLTGCRNG
eukprot:857750-Pelagomonas_calceolata.AAC.5